MLFKATVTVVVEYQPRVSDYETSDPIQMLDLDIQRMKEDPTKFIHREGAIWSGKVERILS